MSLTPPRVAVSTLLVGREKELEHLGDVLARPPAIAMIEGEAGIGKTRLVGELVAPGRVPQAFLVLTGYCQPVREPFPFGPVAEAIAGVADLLDSRQFGPRTAAAGRILPELSYLVPALPEPLDDPRADRHVLLRALREVLVGLGPAILILEDLHWADEGTIELLSLLRSDFPPDLVVIGTYRGEELGADSPLRTISSRLSSEVARERVDLPPLDVTAVGRLVSTMLETDEVSEEFASYLRECTSGIPFAVEEVVRLLQDRHDIVREDGKWARKALEELEVPTSLAESILERLRRLTARARRFLEAASVLGVPAAEQLVASVAVTRPEEAEAAATEALASALMREEPGGLLRFSHPLAMQAVCEAIPGPRRRSMHVKAAQLLEDSHPKPLTRLAHHYREAGHTSEWVRFAEEAADLATSVGDDARAVSLLSEIIDSAVRSGESRARIAVKLGRASYHSRDYADAVAALRRILAEEALNPGERGELRLLLGLLLDRLDEDVAAYVQIERAVPELVGRVDLQARAMAALAIPTFGEPHVSVHVEWSRRASSLVPRVKDPVLRMAIQANHADILLATGDPGAWSAVDNLPVGRTSQEKRERIRCCHNIANEAMGIGYFGRGELFLREAEALARDLSYDRLTLDLRDLRSFLDWGTGRWANLEQRSRQLLSEAGEGGECAIAAEIVLGLLLGAQGMLDEAGAHLQQAAAEMKSRGAAMHYSWAKGERARILTAQGRSEPAVVEALEGVEALRKKGMWTWGSESVPPAVDALLSCSQEEDANRLVEEFSLGLQGRDAPAADAALSMCRGRLAVARGTIAEAVRWYERAESEWNTIGRPHDLARSIEARGTAMLAAGDPSGATVLEEALDGFERLGATWDADRTRRTLRAHGVRLVHRRGRRGYGGDLSPREREVARMAAAGLTNREISERLFLSVSTVKQHVSAALRKTNSSSRAELEPARETTAGK